MAEGGFQSMLITQHFLKFFACIYELIHDFVTPRLPTTASRKPATSLL
jgi:hypothetical protein